MTPQINKDFINEYSSLVTDNICKAHDVDPKDTQSRAVLAWNLSNPDNIIISKPTLTVGTGSGYGAANLTKIRVYESETEYTDYANPNIGTNWEPTLTVTPGQKIIFYHNNPSAYWSYDYKGDDPHILGFAASAYLTVPATASGNATLYLFSTKDGTHFIYINSFSNGWVKDEACYPELVKYPEDLTHLNFSYSSKGSSGSPGSFLKAVENETYYKLSYMSGLNVVGHESINECIANVLCHQFGFEYLQYKLHYATVDIDGHKVTSWLVSSNSYKHYDEQRTTLEIFLTTRGIDINNRKEVFKAILDLPEHIKQRIFEMCIIDYLIYNRDRHGANIELINFNNKYRLAPIFDCGSSLVAPLQDDAMKVKNFDPMLDTPVNNFIGSMILSDMLKMVLEHYKAKHINWSIDLIKSYESCFPDPVYLQKINEIIERRLEKLYEIQNSITR